MQAVGPSEIGRILEITDSLNLHREAVRIPLAPEGAGVVRLVDAAVEIVAPAEGDFEEWLAGLKDQLGGLDLSRIQKADQTPP